MISPKDLIRHELIGLEVKIVDSANKSAIGNSGRVVDETRNTLTVDVAGQHKKFAKDQCTFSFKLPSGQGVRVEGKLLVGRPEDRIKKRLKAW